MASNRPYRAWAAWLVLSACTAYAVVRYIVFDRSHVSVEQLPTYVVNKGVSFAALLLLAWSRCATDVAWRRGLGLFGFVLVGLHLPLSLAIFSPSYFAGFYLPSGRMTWQAEAMVLTGTVALVPLVWQFLATDLQGPARPLRVPIGLGRMMLALSACHVALIGFPRWFTPEKWPGYMPPITLICCLIAGAAVFWPGKPRSE